MKAAVLGTAHGHIYHLIQMAMDVDGAEMLGVYDDDADRLKAAAEKIEAPAFASLDDLLAKKPDVVLIGAVPATRAELAEKAMAAGAGALIDKPIAVTEAQLDRLIAATEKYGKQAITFYPYRGHPVVLTAKKAIEAGRIGELVRIFSAGPHKLNPQGRPAWHFTEENGGVLIDIGSHHFDVCCFFAKAAPTWVCGSHVNFTQPQHKGFQDFGQAQLRFANGVLGHVEVDWLNPPGMKTFGDIRMWFQGTTGKIELRFADTVSAQIWTEDVSAEDLDYSGMPDGDAWGSQLIADIANDRPCEIPQADVWQSSRASLRAFQSAAAGGQAMAM